jgi:Putative transmembrane protein (PGPGW)
MSELFDWFAAHPQVVSLLVASSVLLFVAGVVLTPVALCRLPADYFLGERPPLARSARRHPVLWFGALVLKNVLGGVLVLAGLVMLALPGPGLVTLLVGVTLLNFPGKRALEIWIVQRQVVLDGINWIRVRAAREPLRVPPRKTKPGQR